MYVNDEKVKESHVLSSVQTASFEKSNWNLMKEVSQFIDLLTILLSITRAYILC